MNAGGTVLVVDDEPGLRRALTRLLRAEGLAVAAFASAEEFLPAPPPAAPACVILDVALPGLDGLTAQQRLAEGGSPLPVIFLTGHGDIPMSVRALKAGAVDFLTKPVDAAALLHAVRAALRRSAEAHAAAADTAVLRRRLERLTPREREVLAHVLAGKPNKAIAADLGTVEQTVKVHRGRVMAKLAAASLADLVRLAARLGLPPAS